MPTVAVDCASVGEVVAEVAATMGVLGLQLHRVVHRAFCQSAAREGNARVGVGFLQQLQQFSSRR